MAETLATSYELVESDAPEPTITVARIAG
jgi:hypothetical protein